MAYFGKFFSYDSEDNFSSYVDSLKISKEMAGRVSAKRKIKLDKNGDSYTYIQQNLDGTDSTTFNFKSGETIERELGNNKIKFTFTVDGNTLTQVIITDSGKVTVKREFAADTVKEILITDSWDGTAYRYYKAE